MTSPDIQRTVQQRILRAVMLSAGAQHTHCPGTFELTSAAVTTSPEGLLLAVHSAHDTYQVTLNPDEAARAVRRLYDQDLLWHLARSDALADRPDLPRSAWPDAQAFTAEQRARLAHLLRRAGCAEHANTDDGDSVTLIPAELDRHRPAYDVQITSGGRIWNADLRLLPAVLRAFDPPAIQALNA